jgi:hypothetical protein
MSNPMWNASAFSFTLRLIVIISKAGKAKFQPILSVTFLVAKKKLTGRLLNTFEIFPLRLLDDAYHRVLSF